MYYTIKDKYVCFHQKAAAYEKHQVQVEEQIDKDNKARIAAEENKRKEGETQLHKVKIQNI